MITLSHRTRVRTRASGSLAIASLAIAMLMSACSSGGSTTASADSVTQNQQVCQQVSAVLSNGPDPDTDPVGYAQAQVLPLEQLNVSTQTTIGKAISTLVSDYSSYISANGTDKAANSALTAAINRINSLCPTAGAST
jgi:hypothetical protein